jgi:hypothetical protein
MKNLLYRASLTRKEDIRKLQSSISPTDAKINGASKECKIRKSINTIHHHHKRYRKSCCKIQCPFPIKTPSKL